MLDKMNRYWRAANYLCIGQIYLFENPLLREQLKAEQMQSSALGSIAPEMPSNTNAAKIVPRSCV